MLSIEQTIEQFTDALLANKPVVVNSKGEWGIRGPFINFFYKMFCGEERAKNLVAKAFSRVLDALERGPVEFALVEEKRENFEPYLKASEALLFWLSIDKTPSAALTLARKNIFLRQAALKYRIEAVNGGLNPESPRYDLQSRLQELALNWKSTLEIVADKSLTQGELLAIEELSRYSHYAVQLMDCKAELHRFFYWSLRDDLSPSIFVQYPDLCQKLVNSGLSGRIGRMGAGKVLKIVKEGALGNIQKIVTLPFEGKSVSILDDSRIIEFRGGYTLTLAQIYNIFKNKNLSVGNLEFMEAGIINWNVQKCGWWNAALEKFEAINLVHKAWWEQLPPFEKLKPYEAKARYGSYADGERWIAAATATRGRKTLDVDLTHAYLEVAIPVGEGCYSVLDFGKIANEFPATFIDTLAMVCNTVHATVAYPDENVYYTHRQHAQQAFSLTPIEGGKLMESIKKDMISSRGLNFIYQVESENCAKWVHEKLEAALGEHAIPNMFVMSIFQTEVLSFLGTIIAFCKKLPESWRVRAFTFFHLPLGASKGHWVLERGSLVWKALTHHPFWETGIIYLPCLLHKKKEEGHLFFNGFALTKLCGSSSPLLAVKEFLRREYSKAIALNKIVLKSGFALNLFLRRKSNLPLNFVQSRFLL